MSDVRALAAEVLARAETGRAFVDEILEEARPRLASERDRALLTELVCGVTRRRLTLDYLLEKISGRPKIPPAVRNHLRLALYQILHTRVPPYAAVSEAVELCRAVSPRSAGFANAVLRRASGKLPPLPSQPPARRLSVEHSHPEWLAARWIARHGAKRAEEICRAGNAAPPVTARVRSTGEVVTLKGDPSARPDVQVQDLTQMAAAQMLAPRPGERVLDLCAAPGGKTLHMADIMGNRGEITAVDSSRERLRMVEELRCPIVRCVEADGRRFAGTGFDAVLVDAPCSNTAVLSRRADARWRLRPADIEKLPPLQRALLEAGVRAARAGGRVLYSTCSLEAEENDLVVQAVCRAFDGLELLRVSLVFPSERAAGGFFALMRRGGG